MFVTACGGESGSSPPPPSPTNSSPQFTSNTSQSIVENTVGVAYIASATDADGDAVSFSIVGGTDVNSVSISGTEISFNVSPNFEAPLDANGDNIYEITVEVNDGRGGTSSLSLQLEVTNDKEGISVTRIMTGLVDPIGITPTFTTGSSMAVGLKDGSYILFAGNRSVGDVIAEPITVFPANADFTRMLDIAWGDADEFWRGPMFLYENSFAFSILRPNQSQRRGGNLTFGTNSEVNGKIFIGPSGEAFASLGDPSGNFSQLGQSPSQDRFGRIFRLEPSAGASILSLSANQIAGGIREPGGFAEIDGFTAFADQGGSQEHELSLFTLDIFTQTTNPLNFGWPFREGTTLIQSGEPVELTAPSLVYSFGTGAKEGAGIVLGTNYTGTISGISGHFVFADKNGSIFSLPTNTLSPTTVQMTRAIELRDLDFTPNEGTFDEIVEIAADENGVLYILDGDGDIFRVDSI